MGNYDSDFEDEIVESGDQATQKTITTTEDIIKKPGEVYNGYKNVKDTAKGVKDAAKKTKQATENAKKATKQTKDAAKTTKETAKAGAEAAKTGAEAAKTGLEAAEVGADVAIGAGTAGTGLIVKKGVEVAFKAKQQEKKEKKDKLNNLSAKAKMAYSADNPDATIEQGAQYVKQKYQQRKENRPKSLSDLAVKGVQKAKSLPKKLLEMKLVIAIISFALILFVASTFSFVISGNSIGISTLNYALGERMEKNTLNLIEMLPFISVDNKNDVHFDVEIIWHNPITDKDEVLVSIHENFGNIFTYGKNFYEFWFKNDNATALGISNLIKWAQNFLDGKPIVSISTSEMDKLSSKKDYSSVIFAYVDYLDEYLDKALDYQRQQIGIISAMNGYNEELTRQSFEQQGNPFSSVDYAAILSAYSVKEYDLSNNSLYAFKEIMESVYKKFLTVTYEDDYKKQVTPTPIYKYNMVFKEVGGLAYALYYGDNSPEVRKEVAYSLHKKAEKATNDMERYFLLQDEKAVKNGTKEAKVTDITEFSRNIYYIAYYTIQEDSSQPDGKAVERYVVDEAGEDAPLYLEVFPGVYKLAAPSVRVYPKVEYIKYGRAVFHPFKSTEVFNIFNVNPDADYPYSVGVDSKITNQEQYDIEYQALNNLVDIRRHHKAIARGSGHACSLTKEQIQHYLDLMPSDTSLNRKQLCKTAMGLTGAVSYQMGGPHSAIGWDDLWWQPTGDSYYPYAGPDCAGFVTWATHTAFQDDPIWNSMHWTGGIVNCSTEISKSDLKPGDLGLNNLSQASGGGNHVGIFICYDENGQEIWSDCQGMSSAGTVVTGNRSFRHYVRLNTSSLEGSNYWNDEIITYGSGSNFNQDEQYIMVQVMLQECDTDDAGKRAVAEASANYAERHNATLFEVLTNQVHKNYVSAYKDLYENGRAHFREATQNDYNILNEAASGVRLIFPREQYENNRVTQWCSRGFMNSDFAQWTFVKTVGNNDFYMP